MLKARFQSATFRAIPILVVSVVLSNISLESFADKIYLKSGEVVEGYIRPGRLGFFASIDNDAQNDNAERVTLREGNTYREILASDIVKVQEIIEKPSGIVLLAKPENWGNPKHGYKTQLIPLSKEFVCL